MKVQPLTVRITGQLRCNEPDCNAALREGCIQIGSDGSAQLIYTCEKGHTGRIACTTECTEEPATDKQVFLRTKLSGVTFDNEDGTNRQALLKHVKKGDPLQITMGGLYGQKAILVKHELGILGVLKREVLGQHMSQPGFDLSQVTATVVCVTGGEGDKTTRGCNIELQIQKPNSAAATSQATVNTESSNTTTSEYVYMDRDGKNIFHCDMHCSGLKNAKKMRYDYAKNILKARSCKKCANHL